MNKIKLKKNRNFKKKKNWITKNIKKKNIKSKKF